MSFFGSSATSMSGPKITKLGYRPQLFACLLLPSPISKDCTWWMPSNQLRKTPRRDRFEVHKPISTLQMESMFISALVTAGTCRSHERETGFRSNAPLFLRPTLPSRSRRRSMHPRSTPSRALHSSPHRNPRLISDAGGKRQELSREELKSLVMSYRGSFHTESLPPSTPGFFGLPETEPEGTAPIFLAEDQDESEYTLDQAEENDESPATHMIEHIVDEQSPVKSMVDLIEDERSTHDQLFECYQTLPVPGVAYIPKQSRRDLLRRLSIMQRKSERGMLRYLSLVEDMRAANLPLLVEEWNSAIHLAGRCFQKITELEAGSALRMWKEMELEGGVQGNFVTFNILFDIAVKAERFVLAEMILKEMRDRRLKLTRFGHVGMIYYHGLKEDGDGVRRAYRKLVDDGEIVDTLVMNCVITSLIRAGEFPAAEEVYGRMKALHGEQIGCEVPPRDWEETRELGRLLERAAEELRDFPALRRHVQELQDLSPNVQTYVIMLKHHVAQTGELNRVAALLEEMQSLGLPICGRIFVEIFRGFANHGGVRYTSWTAERLESVWTSFESLLGKQEGKVYVGKWAVVWATRAFAKCCGPDRTLEIWEELKTRWKPTDQEERVVSWVLRTALREMQKRL